MDIPQIIYLDANEKNHRHFCNSFANNYQILLATEIEDLSLYSAQNLLVVYFSQEIIKSLTAIIKNWLSSVIILNYKDNKVLQQVITNPKVYHYFRTWNDEQLRQVIAHALETKRLYDNINSELECTAKKNYQFKLLYKELEQFVYAASHDLRTPLININGYSKELKIVLEKLQNLLASNINTNLPQIQNLLARNIPKYLDFIVNNTLQINIFISGLLQVSQIRKTKLNQKIINVNDLIAQVLKNSAFCIKNPDVNFKVSNLPKCYADASLIQQIFFHLINNSLKCLARERPGKITIFGYQKDTKSIYCVEDNGKGIALQHQQQIFELFHRLEPDQLEGNGIGLTIVEKIVERHKGQLWLQSAPDEGCKFYISIPSLPPILPSGGDNSI